LAAMTACASSGCSRTVRDVRMIVRTRSNDGSASDGIGARQNLCAEALAADWRWAANTQPSQATEGLLAVRESLVEN
jgi:hypothetical protein